MAVARPRRVGRPCDARRVMHIFFATDIHGSDKCWLKFLSAPGNYGCDTIIIGGDITGKFMVPIIADED